MKKLGIVITFLAVLVPLWGEEFFPIGLWSVDKGGFKEAHRESLLIHKSGGNVLCNADKPRKWLDSCQGFNDTIRICAREPFSSSPYRGPWYAVGHQLPFYYPWVYGGNEDSLAWWNSLADMWIDTIYVDYQPYFSVVYLYDVMMTGKGSGTPMVSSPSFPEGVESLCVRIKNKEYWNASHKTFGYGGTQNGRFLSKTKNMDVITRIPVSSPPIGSSPGYAAFQGAVLDWLIKSCEDHHKWLEDVGHPGEFWPEIPIYKDSTTYRRPVEAEMRAMAYVSLAWGAKGFTFFNYKPSGKYIGILDSQGLPYMPQDSVMAVFGEYLPVHQPEDMSDYGYLWFYHLTNELHKLGPVIRKLKWVDAASLHKTTLPWHFVDNISGAQYVEMAIFTGDAEYLMLVNRHCGKNDTKTLNIVLRGHSGIWCITDVVDSTWIDTVQSDESYRISFQKILPPGSGCLLRLERLTKGPTSSFDRMTAYNTGRKAILALDGSAVDVSYTGGEGDSIYATFFWDGEYGLPDFIGTGKYPAVAMASTDPWYPPNPYRTLFLVRAWLDTSRKFIHYRSDFSGECYELWPPEDILSPDSLYYLSPPSIATSQDYDDTIFVACEAITYRISPPTLWKVYMILYWKIPL